MGKGKLSIPAARVTQFANFSRPTTKSQLRSFLGLCNFYARFISNFAHLSSPLNQLLRRDSSDNLTWNDDLDKVFHTIISSITHHTSLVIPNCDEVWCVFSDASLCGIGGVLCVSRYHCWVPCSFFSRQLLPREQKFAATELEALALLETLEHFKLYLAKKRFRCLYRPSSTVRNSGGSAFICQIDEMETQTGGTTPSLLSTSRESRIQWQMHCPGKDVYSHCSSYISSNPSAADQHISLQKQPIHNYSPTPVSSDQAQASEEGGGVVDPPTTHTQCRTLL